MRTWRRAPWARQLRQRLREPPLLLLLPPPLLPVLLAGMHFQLVVAAAVPALAAALCRLPRLRLRGRGLLQS